MSSRWPGSLISPTAPTPTGGGAGDTASGVWTLDQVDNYIAAGTWPGTGTPDPQFQYVTALLHGDGTNGGQNNTFLDSSSNNFTITRNGNTTQGSFSPYGSLWSNYLSGSSGNYLTVPYSTTNFDWWTSDYTIEAWIYVPSYNFWSSTPSPSLVGNMDPTGGYQYWAFGINSSSGRVGFYYYNGSSQSVNSTATIPLNTWSHIAMTKTSSGITLFINGVSQGTTAVSGTPQSSSGYPLSIGSFNNSAFAGNVSNLRIVKGTAVYTSNFTPSTTPLTAISGTQLLTCQSNRFIDNSSNNFTLTVNGTPSVQRFSPFQNLATYQTAKIGGSGYFDGSGDYLTLASNSVFNIFNQTNATVEFWYNPNGYTTDQEVVSYYQDGNNSWFIQFAGGQANKPIKFYTSTGGSNVSLDVNQSSTTFNALQWNHCAFVKSGSTWSIYINGSRVATNGSAPSQNISGTFYIGGRTSTINLISGYVSDVRITNTVVYSGTTYTVPTAPLTAISGTGLLSNTTNGSIYDNAAMNDIETVGSAQISTSVVKYGTGSIATSAAGNYLSAPSTPNMYLGGNFTIEAWVYPTATAGSSNSEIASYGASGQFDGWHFYQLASTNYLGFGLNYSGVIVSSGSALTLNTWSHVAVSRVGTTYLLFINGNQVGSATSSTTQSTNSGDLLRIGTGSYSQGADRSFIGYIDDLRITKGYARYWFNFQPPAAPYPNYGGTLQLTYDPYFANTTLLLNGEGTNGAQNNTILDSSGTMTLSQSGNAWSQGSFSPYGSLWGNYLGTGGTDYLTVASNAAFCPGTSAFCVEFWYNKVEYGGNEGVMINTEATGGLIITIAGGGIALSQRSTGNNIQSAANLTVGQWNHIVACRDSSNVTSIFLNGSRVATGTVTANYATGNLYIGNLPISGYWATGYYSNVRVVKGSTPYDPTQTTLIVPTTPLTAISGTGLLTCQSNRFIDNSTNAFTVVPNGSPQVQRFSPFNPTVPYNTATIGGSLYSQGACELDTSYSGSVGSGDNFTAEGWLYLTRVQDNMSIFITAGALSVMQGASGNQISSYDGSFHNWGYTPKLYEWHYYTIQRSSGTAYVWVDGVYLTSFSYSGSWTWSSIRVIGQTSNRENGYFSNFRYSNTTRYTNAVNFTPPTTPFTTDANTVLLISGTNAGIPDLAMMADWETVGNAQVSTAQYKYGTSSLYFDGTGDYLITTDPTMSPLYDVSGQFTVECWVYLNNNTNGFIFAKGGGAGSWSTSNGHEYLLFMDSGTFYWMWNNGGSNTQITATPPPTGVWTHIAATYDGTTTRLFFNGNIMGTSTTGYTLPTTRNRTTVGVNPDLSTNPLNGYIDDLRITRGLARYVQPFTPPTAALPTY